jgi:O-acetyl-ADP-ribose deacetylase (regulator of RNase III)
MFPGSRTPVYPGEVTRSYDPRERLGACFRSCLTLAQTHKLRSILFPAVSCGVFGCPIPVCAKVAREVVNETNWSPLQLIAFVLFSPSEYESFVGTWSMLEEA